MEGKASVALTMLTLQVWSWISLLSNFSLTETNDAN